MARSLFSKAWKVGSLFGIPIRLHYTFLLLFGGLFVLLLVRGAPLAAVGNGFAFLLAMFACVIAHELGHALVARRFGIATLNITLLPLGGAALLERRPETPRADFFVAIAGPAVNALIAAALYGLLSATGRLEGLERLPAQQFHRYPLPVLILIANVMLVAFNLLPAFPMDGGRMLRALIHSFASYATATRVVIGVGHLLAMACAGAGFYWNDYTLAFASIVMWFGARQESAVLAAASRAQSESTQQNPMPQAEPVKPDPIFPPLR